MLRLAVTVLSFFFLVSAVVAGDAGDRHSRTAIQLGDAPSASEDFFDDRQGPLVLYGARKPVARIPQARRGWARTEISAVSVGLTGDRDGDGFYRGFRLDLDVEAGGGVEWGYFELYLSYQGGPWNFVHRSADHRLVWRYFDNEISLTTFLESGYPTGYYDILIDLFDADTGRWLATVSPYHDVALTAVALEDAGRDGARYHPDGALAYDVVVRGVGGVGAFLMAVTGLLGALRRRRD